MTTFLAILWKFPTTFRRFPKIFQNCSEGQTNVFEHFQTFPNIFRRLPKTTKEDLKMFRSCTPQGTHNLAELPVYLSSSCLVAHKASTRASTQSRQPSLSAATICAPVFPSRFLPFSLRRPSPCCPWSSPFSPPLWDPEVQSLCSSFLMMWRMNFHLLLNSHVLTEVFYLSHLQDFFVCNSFLPAYLKYPSKVSALEDIDFVFIIFIHLPRLTAIHQD